MFFYNKLFQEFHQRVLDSFDPLWPDVLSGLIKVQNCVQYDHQQTTQTGRFKASKEINFNFSNALNRVTDKKGLLDVYFYFEISAHID